ncbi:MAG: WbqC family protein [Bacteroides sp.]|nr:WbqC family protein [Bacteroides sp.]
MNSFLFFENLLLQKYQLLTEFNCNSLIAIARLLDIKTMIVNRSDDYLFVEEELKKQDWPYDTKSQRIILICQYEKAHTYVNAIGGRQLYSKEVFKEQNIDLLFIQSEKYISDEHDILMPELSIIDVLFNYGVEKTKQLLNRFTLIK